MRTSIVPIAGLIALGYSADISCGPALTKGTLWYSPPTSRAYDGQIGVLEAYGNAELLSKYPNSNVEELHIQVLPCNSTYLNATIPPHGSSQAVPVILQLSDDTSNCLALEATSPHDSVFITKQTCQYSDSDAVLAQFWTRTPGGNHLHFPVWAATKAERWNLQFNDDDTQEVLASPPNCSTCQNSTEYSFIIKPS